MSYYGLNKCVRFYRSTPLLDEFSGIDEDEKAGPLWNRGQGQTIHLRQAIGHTNQAGHEVAAIADLSPIVKSVVFC